MKLCSPIGSPLKSDFKAVARPMSLEGMRIGLLDNTKAPVDKMMAHLVQRLKERIPGVKPYYISKNVMLRPAESEVIQALCENADVVINALGD